MRGASVQPMTCLLVIICTASGTVADAQGDTSPAPAQNGSVPLRRVFHKQNLLADTDHSAFGALLYDVHGHLVLHDGSRTWLYTTSLFQSATGGQRDWYGKWISDVREFDARSLVAGPKRVALGLAQGEQWAVIHDVIKVTRQLFVAFYSSNVGVHAAVSATPEGPFSSVAGFEVAVTEPWEQEGGHTQSLEANGAHVLVSERATDVVLWLGYDSYHVDRTAGRLGWAKVRIDKTHRDVHLIEKARTNPLPLLPPTYLAARCGGNLSTDVRIGGRHVFLYYTRPSRQSIMLTIATSSDPLFEHDVRVFEFEPPLADERVIEKFESYMLDGVLHVLYEDHLASGHWGTGIRIYELRDHPVD
jgi:hypothetical protein